MTDNTEEHLENPENIQSKNPTDEITFARDQQTIKSNPQVENMEVHHHPDLHHKPKK